MRHATVNIFLSNYQGQVGVKRSKYHYITITKSISKIFIPKIVCGLTNKRYKTYKTGFLFSCLGHTPEDLGAPGCPGVKK